MSHIETCDVVITDLKSLKKACEELGAAFKENQKTFKRWMDASNPGVGVSAADIKAVEHAIGIPGVNAEVGLAFIGLNKKGVRQYKLLADFYGQGAPLQQKFCKPGSKKYELLNNAYSIEVLKAQARAKGYQFSQKVVNGVTKLTVTLGN